MNISPIFATTPRYSNQQKINSNTSFGHLKRVELCAPKFETEISEAITHKVSKYVKQIQGLFKIPKVVVTDAMGRQVSLSVCKEPNMSTFKAELLGNKDGEVISNMGASISPRGYVLSASYVDNSGKYMYKRTHSDRPSLKMISPNGKVSEYKFSNEQWRCTTENGVKCPQKPLVLDVENNPLADLMHGLIDEKTILF